MRITEMPEGALLYTKRPIAVRAMQINDNFEIGTLEGVMRGQPGDYLIQGIKGELYPCKREIFEATYIAMIDRALHDQALKKEEE